MVALCKEVNCDTVKIFTELGEKILHEWSKFHYSEDALVSTAVENLDKSQLHRYISSDNIIDLSLNLNPSLSAHQIDSPFGDIQQIVYRHAKFYIEALYWCDGITAIHDHAFSGAFCVLSGSSINAEYTFEPLEKINHRFWFGNLSQPHITKLHAGSVRPIYSGRRLIHSVFHLENPTVSIVVRTYQDDDALPQFEYRGNKIRLIQKFSPDFTKKIQGLRLLELKDTDKFISNFKRIYLNAPFDERYWLLRAFYSYLSRIPALWELINQIDNENDLIIIESLADEALLHKTINIRNELKDSELKYFFSLLLNLPTWNNIIEFINNEPSNQIKPFLQRCFSKLDALGFKYPNILNSKSNHSETMNLISSINRCEPITKENAAYHLIKKRMDASN